MPMTDPGGVDDHQHSWEFGANVTGPGPDGHVHLVKIKNRPVFTEIADGHLHFLLEAHEEKFNATDTI